MTADKRVETGPVVFGNDWTGLFIRGNDAFVYIDALIQVIQGKGTDVDKATAKKLVKLLKSTDERIKTDREVPKYYEMPKEKQ